MLIPLFWLVAKYNLNLRGILHVGAHECEELHEYLQYVDVNHILWVEALPEKVALCKQRYPGIKIVNAIASDVVEEVLFNVSNNGQSSSALEFGLHDKHHPHVKYVRAFRATTTRLENVLDMVNPTMHINFVNLDIQGYELRALKGMEKHLPNIDYVYTEVNQDYVYKGCNLIGELDDYLATFGLFRVETQWTNYQWGDAFYMRNPPK